MSAIILLLIVSISVASLFLLAFIWSVKNGQYDDEISPPMRMLFDHKDAITKIPEQTHIKPKS
ncbi:MAG: cbb3-type cytochrome oxidase assembly protein CcoS [Bacteroidota bacterium]